MKEKIISLVSLDPEAGRSYQAEVESLFGDHAQVRIYSTLNGTAEGTLPKADLYVISTDAYGSAEEVARHVPMGSETMAIEVSFRWSELRKLKEIPAGERVLFVNMTQTMAREAITQLHQFGINHITFLPFYPGAELTEDISIAVTPDEIRYVPESVKTVINLGQRSCTSGMMIEIALRLGLEHLLETEKFQEYFRDIATSNYSFDQMFARSIRLESQFHILMEVLAEGIIGVNERGEIFACNRHAEEIGRVSGEMILGKWGDEVFPYIPFSACLKERRRMEAQVRRIHGVNVSVEVVPVLRQETCIGAFAILQKFNEAERRQNELRGQLLKKGHTAKYSFDDVIGKSEAIRQTKEILKRMALSESPVLLIGETGTGKELFAHAIHQASKRGDGPFIAINVAAVPENLLESELFGYEEGAFTGAKKGGRPGLLEFSHKGTLFLDEVEGMSPMLQVKLLRVLQEREIMRVGGDRIINIDVRIVAATNESLEQKVEEGSFRRDLYYRLNTLPVVIPPLEARGDDMFLLMERFKQELNGAFELSDEVRAFLKSYSWPGNIRELRNVVEYFVYTGHEVISMEDLPHTVLKHKRVKLRPVMGVSREAAAPVLAEDSCSDFWFVLEQLYRASEAGVPLGREKLLDMARQAGRPMSQLEVRRILSEMAEKGLALVSRGRGGSRLTPEGKAFWENREM